MHDLLKFFNNTLFLYYLGSNLVYLMLLITALVSSTRHRMRLASMKIDALKDSPFTPPISIICPARNEEASIVGSVQALLDLHYPELEVIVVNDGSSDRTLEFLRKEFALYPVEMLYHPADTQWSRETAVLQPQ